MQKFKVIRTEKATKNTIIVSKEFDINEFKKDFINQKIFIDQEFLNLNQKLYGDNLTTTKTFQKKNFKQLKVVLKKIKQIIKYFRRHKINFENKFYITCENPQNNNAFMLESTLNICFASSKNNILSQQIEYSCDYIDKELQLSNVCNFQNGKCKKYNKYNNSPKGSCCKDNCKYGYPCSIKNIACKIFMCEKIRATGFSFFPEYFLSLGIRTNFIDIAIMKTAFFIPLNNVVKLINISRIILSILIIGLVGFIIFNFIF